MCNSRVQKVLKAAHAFIWHRVAFTNYSCCLTAHDNQRDLPRLRAVLMDMGRFIVMVRKGRFLKLSKLQAACRQTDAAIKAFRRGNFDIAITLAGAAEGMIARRGQYAFSFMKDRVPDEVDSRRWISILNRERDWLKHPSGTRLLQIDRFAAAYWITRASDKLSWRSPEMKEFKTWLSKSLDKGPWS